MDVSLPPTLNSGRTSTAERSTLSNSGPAGGLPVKTVTGNYGLYALGDQAILRWGDPRENRHLGIFAAFNWAPDQRVNQMPYFFDTGLVAYGLLPSRPQILRDFGVVYGSYSGDLQRAEMVSALTNPSVAVQNYETTLELTYGCALRPGLLLQPDLQYIIHPGGNRAIPNALAFGVNSSPTFDVRASGRVRL